MCQRSVLEYTATKTDSANILIENGPDDVSIFHKIPLFVKTTMFPDLLDLLKYSDVAIGCGTFRSNKRVHVCVSVFLTRIICLFVGTAVGVQYRIIIIAGLLLYWFTIRRVLKVDKLALSLT